MTIWKEYYFALGAFVDAFAEAENFMFSALQETAGVDGPTAKALFSGTRIAQAASNIKRLHEARGSAPPTKLLEAFEQLAAITSMRDQILHYGTTEVDGSLQTSTEVRAHSPRTVKVYRVSAETLRDMTADLETILTVLFLYLKAPTNPDPFGSPPNSEDHRQLQEAARAPWRYKSAQPATKSRKPPRPSPAPQPPHSASPA